METKPTGAKLSETERNAISNEYMDFTKSMAQSGHLRGGNELKPISTATTVRLRTRNAWSPTVPSPKPRNNSAATIWLRRKTWMRQIGLAARIPSARWGSIEVRPINPHDMP